MDPASSDMQSNFGGYMRCLRSSNVVSTSGKKCDDFPIRHGLPSPSAKKGRTSALPSPSYPHGSASMPGANWVNVTKKPGDNRKTTQVAGLKPHFLSLSLLKLPICWDSIPIFDITKWSDDLLFFVKMELLAIFCISNHPNFFGVRILSHTQQQKRKRRWKSRSASRTYTVTCLSCLGPLRRVRATQDCVDAVLLRAGAIPFVDLHEQGIEKQFLWLNHLWPTRSIRSPSVGQLADF